MTDSDLVREIHRDCILWHRDQIHDWQIRVEHHRKRAEAERGWYYATKALMADHNTFWNSENARKSYRQRLQELVYAVERVKLYRQYVNDLRKLYGS